MEPTTTGEEFIEKILAGIPPSDAQPDLATVRLSNQPSSTAESVSFDALKGRTVGDMGFGYVSCHVLGKELMLAMGCYCSYPINLFLPIQTPTLRLKLPHQLPIPNNLIPPIRIHIPNDLYLIPSL